ncbi:MAG: four-helix bundle copper-binding protein [Arenibacter latericius]|nr:four-helix bundle copper-binding protein [Arenibacter latericius]
MELKYQDCIDACLKCIKDCEYCLIQTAGMESKNDCPKCCILCIEACTTTMKFLMADSSFAKEYCRLCAEVCQWCAEQCGQHDHQHCEDCANSCVKCMEECRKILAA